MTRRATFTTAELVRAIRAADKRRAVMGTNEEGTLANPLGSEGKSNGCKNTGDPGRTPGDAERSR